MSEPTVAVGPLFYVEAPDVAPTRGGLLDVATVTDLADAHAQAGGVEYTQTRCLPAGLAPGLCCTPVETDERKSWESPEGVCGGPYGIYKGVGCDIFGEPYTQMASEGLERGEGFALEKAFYQEHLATATVLAEGLCPVDAVATLEQYIGENYAGTGMLHTNRYGAVQLGAADVVYPGMEAPLTTILGTPVAASAGNGAAGPGGDAAPDGQFWVWATGHVHLWRTPLEVYEARDLESNQSFAVAERVWSATVECFIVAVLATSQCQVAGS